MKKWTITQKGLDEFNAIVAINFGAKRGDFRVGDLVVVYGDECILCDAQADTKAVGGCTYICFTVGRCYGGLKKKEIKLVRSALKLRR